MDEPPGHDPLPKSILRYAPWRWRRRWLVIPILMIAYPLSLGPVVWLHDRQRLPEGSRDVLMAIYLPLWFVMQTEPGRQTLGRYVGFWETLP